MKKETIDTSSLFYIEKYFYPLRCLCKLTTFSSKQAMVIGPTPPGTGVIAPAIFCTLSKSTSPTVLLLTLLVPTSMIIGR